MYWLVGLGLLGLVLEGLLSSEGHRLAPPLRKLASAWAITLALIVAISLCLDAWHIWIWSVPLTVYRCINMLRIYWARLPAQQLRTVSLRAFGWLVIAQTLLTVAVWLIAAQHLKDLALNTLVTLQLLCALAILRVTLHTWQHAGAPNDRDFKLSDKELPSVSVLVPARNETDDLQQCLERIMASDYPKLEVLVLDDCSATRRTPEIIRSFAHTGVRFIQGDVPDESRWLAKNYAYEQLSREASGDVLLFCGVDVVLEPGSIRQLVGILQTRKKDMLSVMPLRMGRTAPGTSLLQAMRYYWEMCLPRRFFKRPPVLSTCWLIRSRTLEAMGGFESVSRSIHPEAPLARKAVITDAYSFIRSDSAMGIYSDKPAEEQYATSVRVRYPQLHRRLELVALAAAFELIFMLGPFLGLFWAVYLAHAFAYIAIWCVSLACLMAAYGVVAGGARLTNPWYGWLFMPIAFAVDLLVVHISLWKYEFSSVNWKGRNVCIPVMQVIPRLPELPAEPKPRHK